MSSSFVIKRDAPTTADLPGSGMRVPFATLNQDFGHAVTLSGAHRTQGSSSPTML